MRVHLTAFVLTVLPTTYLSSQDNITPDSVDIEQVIISASRADKSDPVTIQNISLEEIETINAGQDPSVLLQQLSPSIVSYSDAGTDIGNYAQFRMRGISQSRINVTLNGVPLNDMIDQGVFFSNFSDFGNSIESIQIQRGVGASNVGIASYGGAVNFESTRIFGEDSKSNFELTTGSFGTLRTSAEINTGLRSGNWGGYGRFTRTSTDGYKNNSASDSYSAFGSVGKSGDRYTLKFTGFMGKTQNDQSYLPVLLSDLSQDPRTNYNHPNDTDDFEQELAILQYSKILSDQFMLDASVYYGGARGVFPFAIDNSTQFVYGLSNDHYGLMSNFKYDRNKLSIKGGIQAYQFKRTNYEYLAPDKANPYDRDHSEKFEFSTFGKANYEFDNLSIYSNLQLRSVRLQLIPDELLRTGIDFKHNWLFLNWVAGFNFSIRPNSSIYLSYGRTGREPTRSDIRNGAEIEEVVKDLEIGWEYSNSNFDVKINLFHMTFENEISQVGALEERSYIEIRKNVPESRRSGIEMTFNYMLSNQINVGLNGSLMNTNVSRFSNGNIEFQNVEHIFSPKYIFSPLIRFQGSRISAQISSRHVGDSFMELGNIDSFKLPSHTVINSQVMFDFSDRISATLQLNNILNEVYYTDGAPVDLDFDGLVEGPGYRIQPPRHFYIKFGMKL